MIGKPIAAFFCFSRDAVARGLLAMRVTPNMLTLLGMALTAGAGVCYATGSGDHIGGVLAPAFHDAGREDRSLYLLLAGALLILSSACDMLDGAVARLGNLKSRFGAFLDSTMDRYSDFAVYAGIALYYAWPGQTNVTFAFLAMLAFFNGFMIAYTRARAEDLIEQCKVGYWQRGERSAALLIATFSFNIPALLVQQAFLPLLTVLRRVFYTKAVIDGKTPITDPRQGNWYLKARLWRWPRLTLVYDFVTAVNIAWLIFFPMPNRDYLREWLGG